MSKRLQGNLVNGFILDKGHLGIDQNVRDSMQIYYRRTPGGDKISAPTVDEALQKADTGGYNYIILTWEGNVPKLAMYHPACVDHIEWLERKYGNDWLISGHIIDQYQNRIFMEDIAAEQWKDSFFLFPITAIVNINKWKELGRPEWGEGGSAQSVVGIPSEEQVHDNYTPLSLMPPGNKTMKKVRHKPGWNLINQSLLNNMPVHNMTEDIRVGQIYMYPEDDTEKYNNFWRAVHLLPSLTGMYDRAWETISLAHSPTRSAKNSARFFLINTEDYSPVPSIMTPLQLANSLTAEEIDYSSFKLFIGPAAGWKGFILDATKMHNVKTHLHFDIYRECVEIRQKFIARWDGRRSTHNSVLTAIGTEIYPDDSTGHQAYHMNENENFDFSYNHILKHIYPDLDPASAPDDILCKAWAKYRNKSHKFVTGDILSNPKDILWDTRYHGLERTYLWLSDIASWRINVLAFGMRTLRSQLTNVIKFLLNKSLTGVVDFRDTVSDAQLFKDFEDAVRFLQLDTMEDVWAELSKDLIKNNRSSPELR